MKYNKIRIMDVLITLFIVMSYTLIILLLLLKKLEKHTKLI